MHSRFSTVVALVGVVFMVTLVGAAPAKQTADKLVATASRSSLPVFTTVRAARSGRFEVRLRVAAATRPGARCDLTVHAGKKRSSFPPLVATEGLASWQWIVPNGAPSGKWVITSACRLNESSGRNAIRPIVLVPAGIRGSGLVAPGTISVKAGRFVKEPRAQVKLPASGSGTGGSKGAGNGNPGEEDYCTWGAWNEAQWLGTSVSGHANNWAKSAEKAGLAVGRTPIVGAVWVRESGKYGHVGVVTQVISKTQFKSKEMNGGNLIPGTDYKTTEFGRYVIHDRTTGPDIRFIYKPGTQPGAWVNHIVHWDADPKAQKTAWLVGPDGNRRWIPDIPTYNCLKARGVPGPEKLAASVLDQYPDLNGVWVTCSQGGIGAGSGPYPPESSGGGSEGSDKPAAGSFQLASALTASAPQGWYTGRSLAFAFTVRNVGGSALSAAVFSVPVRGPGGQVLDVPCSGGGNVTVQAGAMFTCNGAQSFAHVGTYTYWADWRDTGGTWHQGQFGANKQFTLTQESAPPPQITLTVYNQVTNGASAMREDSSPAYLSTVMQNFCKSRGCAIAGTDRGTGGTLGPAVCQGTGERTTNGQDNSSIDDGNPGLLSSTRWYGVALSGGGRGYISEVWIQASQRGGLGLPGC